MGKEKKESKIDKGNLFKTIIIVFIAVGIAGGSFFAGIMVDKLVFSKETNKVEKTKDEVKEVMFTLDDFLVNLADKSGRRYLKAKIYLGYGEDKKLSAELEEKKLKIRDAIINVLRTKKTEDLNEDGTERLKIEIKDTVNMLLNEGKITNVYFSDILIQ
ncbi:flagellar basal body-associated protein FliL [Clostridium tepidiprofundi DSM 19306]|uniref:Flagellar protein FliL n=1 Tax=Clostridium tepidiprofundi DSM 19306 TaxID=1121338 RepID=A0A151B746_9CLOT|nr:flagellar basal body-associated FliL family protein [Clostridium tepidiprofundi]KYH35610.1 flagellar basal body-associated protein FliL [Clostridium tepidiprofundi DSM 19306]